MKSTAPRDTADVNPTETREWLESLDYLIDSGGPHRAARLLRQLEIHARKLGVRRPFTANTPYVNTIRADDQVPMPGSNEVERRIKSLIRWNALAMVVRANKASAEYGGHIATYASSATLYEVGFNHFFRGSADGQHGDLVFIQPHSAPGVYSRAFLEGRLTESHFALPPGSRRRRPVLVPAPLADARVLAISHRFDGPGGAQFGPPGALHALPGRARPAGHRRPARLGHIRRREAALHIIRSDRPDLVVLDLMLPDRDGWSITRIVRGDQALAATPIVMLTARVEGEDRVMGLDLGADDYIPKPFNPHEVVARVRAVLRRANQDFGPAHIIQIGQLLLDADRHEVQLAGKPIELTPTEFDLLKTLMEYRDTPLRGSL